MSDIRLEGLDEVLASLDDLADTSNIENTLTKACLLVEATAKQKAPKGTGELRRSITSKVNGTTGMVYTPLEYAPYVEYGTGLYAEFGGRQDVPWTYRDEKGNWQVTSGMHPSPYFRPALYENREKILKIIKDGIING